MTRFELVVLAAAAILTTSMPVRAASAHSDPSGAKEFAR